MRPNPTLKPTAVFGVQASLLVNSSRPNHLERSEHPTGRLLGQTTGYTLGLRLHSAARRLFLSPFLHSPFARSFTARCSSLFSFLFSFFLFFLPPVSLRFCSVSVISFCLSTHRHFHLLESFRASDQPTPASLATYFVFISISLKEKERKKKEKKLFDGDIAGVGGRLPICIHCPALTDCDLDARRHSTTACLTCGPFYIFGPSQKVD